MRKGNKNKDSPRRTRRGTEERGKVAESGRFSDSGPGAMKNLFGDPGFEALRNQPPCPVLPSGLSGADAGVDQPARDDREVIG